MFEQLRRCVQVSGGAALLVDVPVDPLYLFGREAELTGNFSGWDLVVLGPEDHVELRVVHREVKVLLGLLQAVGVRGRLTCQDPLDHAKVPRERVCLGLVEAGDGLDVGGAVAKLHEEPLVVLETVGGAGYRIDEPVGVVVLHHLAAPLLEVGGRHDLKVCLWREADALLCPSALGLHHHVIEIDGVAAEPVAVHHDFPAVIRRKIRVHRSHGFVPRGVTAGGGQHRRDVVHDVIDPQLLGEFAAELRAERARVLLGQQKAEDAARSDGTHGERSDAGRIDAARDRHYQPSALELLLDRFAQGLRQAIGRGFKIQRQRVLQINHAPTWFRSSPRPRRTHRPSRCGRRLGRTRAEALRARPAGRVVAPTR